MTLTYPWIKNAFEHYNAKYFENKLQMPRFSLKCPPNNWGYYLPDGTYNQYTRNVTVNSPGTIYLNGDYSREEKDWIGTLLHEMIHMYINTVLLKYPINQHGTYFKNIAKRLNTDGWNISEANELKKSDTKAKTNDTDKRPYENRLFKPFVFCVIQQPKNDKFKLWGFRAENNILNDYILTAKKLKQYGATRIDIYYCYSQKLGILKTSSQNLLGIGANDYNTLINKISQSIGETLNKQDFNLIKNITL